MPHELFGEKFYSHRQPAWHGLGLVNDEELTASESFEKIGPYDVHLEDLVTPSGLNTGLRAIVRDPVPGIDDQPRFFGSVGPEYQLITPWNAVKIWDSAVTRHVETIGVLYSGSTIFITTKLPSFDVKNDQVDNYLLFVSPMDGLAAAQLRVTPVRVVCNNTLVAAKSQSSVAYKVVHDEHAVQRLTQWLGGAMEIIETKTEGLKEAFRAMADRRLTPDEVQMILERAYVMPKTPVKNAPDHVMVQRAKDYEFAVQAVNRQREAARQIFDGKGVGQETEAAKGTAWGLYNSIVELGDYGRSTKLESRAVDTLFGQRASAKERAFEAVLDELK